MDLNFLKTFDFSPKNIFKFLGIFLVGVGLFVIIVWLAAFSIKMIISPFREQAPSYGRAGYPAYQKQGARIDERGAIMPPQGGGVMEKAEQYEVKEYSFFYESVSKEEICDKAMSLKPREDIVFEKTDLSDYECRFRFLVKKEKSDEIVAFLRELGPRDVYLNIYSIESAVKSIEDQIKILRDKLSQVEKTLKDAQDSYDSLMRLAARKEDVESLTKLIDLKLNTINKLAQEKGSIISQIKTLEARREEQMKRLDYTVFSVSVSKYLFFDWKFIKQQWRAEIRNLIDTFDSVLRGVTIKLLDYLMRVLQGLIYLFAAVILLKLAIKGIKKVWSF